MVQPTMTWGQITLTGVIKLNSNGGLSNALNTWDSVSHLSPFPPESRLFSGELAVKHQLIIDFVRDTQPGFGRDCRKKELFL
jgi:hypothetical protein